MNGLESAPPAAPPPPLDYETPPRPCPPKGFTGRKRARRALAIALLAIGLFFGLSETIVFGLGTFAIGPFDDMRHKGFAARAGEMIPFLIIALTGYGVAIIGYFLDRAGRRPQERAEGPSSGRQRTSD